MKKFYTNVKFKYENIRNQRDQKTLAESVEAQYKQITGSLVLILINTNLLVYFIAPLKV